MAEEKTAKKSGGCAAFSHQGAATTKSHLDSVKADNEVIECR